MKKIDNVLLAVGGLLIVGGLAFVLVNRFFGPAKPNLEVTPNLSQETEQMNEALVAEAIKNSELTIPDTTTKVQLVDGVATYSGQNPVYVTFVGIVGETQIAKDNFDVFGSYAINYGGSGDFVYVGLFNATPKGIVHTSSTPSLGDRILIESATASASMTPNYDLTVSYLDRSISDPMSTPPSIPYAKVFKVEVR